MIIRKLFKAEAAHRVSFAYTERCRGLHGHSYLFEIFIKGKTQDNAQMLLDFKYLKEKLNDFLDSFDHSLLIWDQDEELMKIGPKINSRYIILPYNSTAEQMSRHIYQYGIKQGLDMHKVIVHETKTGYAEFTGDDEITIDIDKVQYSQAVKADWKIGI